MIECACLHIEAGGGMKSPSEEFAVARKKNDQNPIAIIAIIGAILLAYVTPFVIFITWIVSEIRMRNGELERLLPLASIDPLEIELLASYRREVSQAKAEIAQLDSEGDGLRRKDDHTFDERSGLGKRLNQAIMVQMDRTSLARENIESLQRKIDSRYSAVSNRIALRESARWGVIVWSATFLSLFILKEEWSEFAKAIAASLVAIACSAPIYLRRNMAIKNLLMAA